MNYSIISHNRKRFLKLEVVQVHQKSHSFYISKAPALELVDMFTVSPAKYDVSKYENQARKFPEENEYFNEIINAKNRQIKEFQREKDPSRVNSISKFILENEYSFFPNTIICTCDILEIDDIKNIEDVIDKYYKGPESLSFLFNEDDKEFLIIPIVKESVLVIDGQHRLEGLKKYINDNPLFNENYEVLLSFFIDYDRAIVAQQFYTINYEQKSVNKSILYHLMGEFSDEINELTLLHNFVRLLNELTKSPFHNRIKMLGKTPLGIEDEQKSKFSISQAFLIDELLKTISSKASNGLYQPIFLRYFRNEEEQIKIVKFLIRYFNAIKSLNPDWNDPEASILSKGMGVGALIKVLQLLFPILLFDEFNGDGEAIIDLDIQQIKNYLKGIEDTNLSSFSGQGSAGSMNRIKEVFIENINYLNTSSYTTFERKFRNDYLQRFKDWNKSRN